MKVSAVVVAASLGQATATFFHNAPPFTCPGNSNNKCLDEYRTGLNWQDLSPGSFNKYKGFLWKGYQAADRFSKRSDIGPRTFQDKCIAGKATKNRDDSPKMSCDTSIGNDKTSIREIQIETAFDCDLEFHYGMPDGSICKERHHCPSAGTTVPNKQCGGATDVTIVYPHQPQIPHDGCDFAIPSIGFDCDDNTPPPASTKPPVPGSSSASKPTYPASLPPQQTTSSTAAITTSSTPGDTYTASVPGTTSSTASATTLSTVPATASSSTPVDTYSAIVPPGTASTASTPVGTASTPVGTASTPVGTASTPVGTASTPVGTGSSSTPEGTYSVTQPGGAGSTSSSVPATGTTSTSAGPDNSYSVTVPNQSTTASTLPATGSSSVPAGTPSTPAGTSSGPVDTPSGTTTAPSGTASQPAPSAPVETLPCPSVVPSCLNTWMFVVSCIDNTDSACYCPDEKFVKNVFSCMYAHGESDDVIKEAVEYFQGICAPYVPQNPAIGTGAQTITNILTVTQTTPPTAVYTTIEVTATSVVPCTDAQGSEIPSSSSTIVYSTTISVPEVQFTTITSGPGTTQVGIIPGAPTAYPTATAPSVPSATGTFTAPANGGGNGNGGSPTTPAGAYPTACTPGTPGCGTSGGGAGITTRVSSSKPGSQPTGTGGVTPSATATIPIAAAGRVGGSVVAGVAALAAVVFVL